MDGKEFLNEAHKYIDDLYKDFTDYQNDTNKLLYVFMDFCKENNIKYFIAYGSLLGLIRDNGSIPWDYDADVAIPITEVEKIEKFADKLPSDYYFESNYSNKNSQFYQMRLLKKGTDHSFLHLDIFYVIGAPSNADEIEKVRKEVRKIFDYRFYWYTTNESLKARPGLVRKMYLKHKLRKAYGHHSIKNNDRRFAKLVAKYDYDKAEKVMFFNTLAEDFDKAIIEPFKFVEVNQKSYSVPHDVDRFLKQLYKNYQSYLPIANRFEEFYTTIYRYNASKGKIKDVLYRKDGEN